MWFLLQSLIIFAVGASNIYWHWTPNGYLVGMIGVGLAWVATRLLSSTSEAGRMAAPAGRLTALFL